MHLKKIAFFGKQNSSEWENKLPVYYTAGATFHSQMDRSCDWRNSSMFWYGGGVLDTVNSFKYLGVELSKLGNFVKCKKNSFDKASKQCLV